MQNPALHRVARAVQSLAQTSGARMSLLLLLLACDAIEDSPGTGGESAAETLGMGLRTLYEKLKRFELG